MKIFLLKMLYGFAQIVDGLIGIISFTMIRTSLTLKAAENISRTRYKDELKEMEKYI